MRSWLNPKKTKHRDLESGLGRATPTTSTLLIHFFDIFTEEGGANS
jgi:hypothetical protein